MFALPQQAILATVTNRKNLATRKKSDYFEMIFSHSVPFSRTEVVTSPLPGLGTQPELLSAQRNTVHRPDHWWCLQSGIRRSSKIFNRGPLRDPVRNAIENVSQQNKRPTPQNLT